MFSNTLMDDLDGRERNQRFQLTDCIFHEAIDESSPAPSPVFWSSISFHDLSSCRNFVHPRVDANADRR
jgi:hypothetical protein